MTRGVLSDEERHQMIIEAVTPGSNIKVVSEGYGINRNTLYGHLNRAVRDPEGQWKKAVAEAEFRRRVYEITR